MRTNFVSPYLRHIHLFPLREMMQKERLFKWIVTPFINKQIIYTQLTDASVICSFANASLEETRTSIATNGSIMFARASITAHTACLHWLQIFQCNSIHCTADHFSLTIKTKLTNFSSMQSIFIRNLFALFESTQQIKIC